MNHRPFAAAIARLRDQIAQLPLQPGVYRFHNAAGAVLYIGKARRLRLRVASYLQRARLPLRLQRMIASAVRVDITVTKTEAEALLLEANQVRDQQPPYNIRLKDDKAFPYILLTRHEYPQLQKHRGARRIDGWYYGPFASGAAVASTMEDLQRVFQLRNCSDAVFRQRTRPCLQYHIKRCTAPCVGLVTAKDYTRQVTEARTFLAGDSRQIQTRLAGAMQQASDQQDFERAALLRDRIKALTTIQARQDINLAGLGDADVLALYRQAGAVALQIVFYRGGHHYGARTIFPSVDAADDDAAVMAALLAQFYADHPPPPLLLLSHPPAEAGLLSRALRERAGRGVRVAVPVRGGRFNLVDHALANGRAALQLRQAERSQQGELLAGVAALLGLPDSPQRIEIYDNSHVLGSHAVGAMVVAGPEGFIRKAYRRFNIRTVAKGDDYAMLEEVLRRRFARMVGAAEGWNRPDLLILDGGKGQLSRARAVLAELGLADMPLLAVAKGPERHAGRERFFATDGSELDLPLRDTRRFFLQRLRDEAHRFAIGAHRGRREAAIRHSALDDVPAIGPKRRRQLLHHFGSAQAVAEADLARLRTVPGISAALAKKIHDFFHPGD